LPPNNKEKEENCAQSNLLPSQYEILESSKSDGGGRKRETWKKRKKRKKGKCDSSMKRGLLLRFGLLRSGIMIFGLKMLFKCMDGRRIIVKVRTQWCFLKA